MAIVKHTMLIRSPLPCRYWCMGLALVALSTAAACRGAAGPERSGPLPVRHGASAPSSYNGAPEPLAATSAEATAPAGPAAQPRPRPAPPPPLQLPRLEADLPPANEAAERVMGTLEQIQQSMVMTRYQPGTVVDQRTGVFYWDCSGMADWILRRAAPLARLALTSRRPVARDFYDVIARSPLEEPRRGWLRIAKPEELRPGDLFAWLKPPHWKRANTGHVGFLLTTAKQHPAFPDVWLMRIADATSVLHGDDSRSKDGDGGFGTGTVAFRVDPSGQPWAYGWYGGRQRPSSFVPTEIAFGRVTK